MRISDWSSDVCSSDLRSLTFTIYWLFAALVCGILSMPAHLFATISGNPIPLLTNLPAAPDSNEMEMQLRRAFAPWTRWVFERAAPETGRYDPAILACIIAQVRSEEHTSLLHSLMSI